MAEEIVNAVHLMRDSAWRDWVQAATCYHARSVLTSNAGAAAKKLALDTITSPATHLDRWIRVLATDPAICAVGREVGDGQGKIGQALLLTQVGATWASLAGVLYPQG